MMRTAQQALLRLREGNRRFVEHGTDGITFQAIKAEEQVSHGQTPSAIILGCSDSRVPAEIIFDQGLGDLFVIRVAGNVVAPSQIGSVEFAAEKFGTRLVVVLGHSCCGAVNATLEELERPSERRSHSLSSIVNRIRPSVETLLESGAFDDRDKLLDTAIRANIRSSVQHLRQGSLILEDLIATRGLRVVGAEYSLETGAVDFFDTLDIDAGE